MELAKTRTLVDEKQSPFGPTARSKFRKLPNYILISIGGSILICIVTFLACLLWVTTVLDEQALANSEVQIRNARTNLLAKSRMIVLDYANWDAAVSAMRQADTNWLYENIGSAALVGNVVQFALMWDGSLDSPLGWTTKTKGEIKHDLISDRLMKEIRSRLTHTNPSELETLDFFEWSEGRIFAFSAARFYPVYGATPPGSKRDTDGQLLMGLELTEDTLSTISKNSFLEDLKIEHYQPRDKPYITLTGLQGEVTAFVSWDAPLPGDNLLQQLAPVLCLIAFSTICIIVLIARFIHGGTIRLIQSERQAIIHSKTDALTGLLNRSAFSDLISSPSAKGERAMIFLDLNGFKNINDNEGHAAGDAVIVALSKRLRSLLMPGTFLAHISGDEFAFLILEPDAEARATQLAERIAAIFDTPFEVNTRLLHLHAAIGIAFQTDHTTSGSDLMKQADLAMYEAKRNKARRPTRFDSVMAVRTEGDFLVEQQLRTSLAKGEGFSVYYQPIVSSDRSLVRAEALVRWSPNESGRVSPSKFIPIAERTGMIGELGRIIFRQICADLAAHPLLKVSVNISTIEFLRPGFASEIAQEVERHSINPSRLELELTESIVIESVSTINSIFSDLRQKGFSIALDDFGTGFSSISYLDRLVLDSVKLDRAFASDISSSGKRLALVELVVSMAHRLDLTVICEGVETEADLRLLHEIGCDYVQGFLFDEPLPVNDLCKRWLPDERDSVAA